MTDGIHQQLSCNPVGIVHHKLFSQGADRNWATIGNGRLEHHANTECFLRLPILIQETCEHAFGVRTILLEFITI